MKTWTFPLHDENLIFSTLSKSVELKHEQEETLAGDLLDTYLWSNLQNGVLCIQTDALLACVDYFHPQNSFSLPVNSEKAHSALKKLSKDWQVYPRARCQIHTKRYLLRDNEQKGICRLEILTCSAEEPVELQIIRVSLDPLRGYEEESAPLESQIENLQAASPPPDVTLPIDLPPEPPLINPHAAARFTVIELSLGMLCTARYYEKGIIEGIDAECLHQYRVSLRRLRALLSLLKELFPADEVELWREELSDIMKGTNKLRDLDVQLIDMDQYLKIVPLDYQAGFYTIIERSKKTRDEQQLLVAEYLQSSEYQNRITTIRSQLEAASTLPPTETSSLPTKTVVNTILTTRYKKMKKKIKKLTGHEDYSHLHKVRIDGKKLRYLCEFFAPLYSETVLKPVVKQLKKVQNALGDYNDLCTQFMFFQEQAHHARAHGEVDAALAIGGISTVINQKCEAMKTQALDRVRSFVKDSTDKKIAHLTQEEEDEVTGVL